MSADDAPRLPFCDPDGGDRPPVAVAWGAGVDSTAMIIELVERGEPIDIVLIAKMPERPETQAYIPMFRRWMDERGIANEMVGYRPSRFKNWPPYHDLLENCLTNGTLPSIAFGRGACSLKWKVAPQDAWMKTWAPAQRAWARGQKVVRLIGYDCSKRDSRRYAHAEGYRSALYTHRYPLREWGWDREACEDRIRRAGLPVPVASSCFFCTGMTPDEVRTLPPDHLRLIALMEARAKPRLRTSEGLWRSSTKGLRGKPARPGSMTDFIRSEGLLEPDDLQRVIDQAPLDLVAFLDVAASLPLEQRPTMESWIERFRTGAAAVSGPPPGRPSNADTDAPRDASAA